MKNKEVLTLISHVLQIAREDLQYKVADGRELDLFKDFKLLNAIRDDIMQLRDKHEGVSYQTFTNDGKLLIKNHIDVGLFLELKKKHSA